MKNGLIIDEYGTKRWYLNGERHRTDGPAIEYPNGTKYWYLNDKQHRTDGPAVVRSNGSKAWYLNGECLSEENHRITTRNNKLTELLDL